MDSVALGRYVGWGWILNCFMLSSLPCFYAFCWSAIPTSGYIFNVFLFLLYIWVNYDSVVLCTFPKCSNIDYITLIKFILLGQSHWKFFNDGTAICYNVRNPAMVDFLKIVKKSRNHVMCGKVSTSFFQSSGRTVVATTTKVMEQGTWSSLLWHLGWEPSTLPLILQRC